MVAEITFNVSGITCSVVKMTFKILNNISQIYSSKYIKSETI